MRIVLLIPVAGLLLLAAVYLLTPRAILDMEPPERGYTDVHAHIGGIGAGGSGVYVHPDLADSFKFGFYLRWLGVSREELDRHGDARVAERLNRAIVESRYVARAVIPALDGVVREDAIDRAATQLYIPNEFTARMAERYGNLEFGASVHPDRSDWRQRLLDAQRRGAVLVRWFPAVMDIDPSDRRHIDYYRTLVELDLPLLVHVGRQKLFSEIRSALGDPEKLTLPLERGVTVIATHLGTTGSYEGEASHERLLGMLADHPRLYTDIAGLTQLNRVGYLVNALERPVVADRMLYGSGWPLQFFPLVSPLYHWPDVDLGTVKTIQLMENRLDRDIALKKALGVQHGVFERSGRLLTR
ncbi:MAG: amidohydrolase family protein [Gammaproteobacteria bacterium]|nr:amidohydrolase family protein [Gammaproteobacteria bacterium]